MSVIQDLISVSNTKKIKMVNIYYKDLIANKNNSIFKQEDIEQLAQNIREIGLLEPLVVTELASGEYLLVSGHRRTLAHQYLVEELGLEEFEDIACRVIQFLDHQDELIALFSSNAQRQYDLKDKQIITEKAGELYDQLVREGKRPPGRKREWIAQLTGFSSRSVQDYLAASSVEGNVATLPQSEKKEKSILKQAQSVEKSILKLINRLDKEGVTSNYISSLENSILKLIDDLIEYEQEGQTNEYQLSFDDLD